MKREGDCDGRMRYGNDGEVMYKERRVVAGVGSVEKEGDDVVMTTMMMVMMMVVVVVVMEF